MNKKDHNIAHSGMLSDPKNRPILAQFNNSPLTGSSETAVPGLDECFQEMEGGHDLANGAESFHCALWRPDGGRVGSADTIANRAYAPKPGAPARPAIVREACQQLAGDRTILEKRYLHKIANTTDFN